ncbi:hypothetical protein ZOD2009_00565 [Haladaptatus paucihalophilus DX253]|uniref:Uncharacterized membrane protein n=1 Tax=Haladaptatus paucihalophilus DX253 TaxID=797209 RepID=E7QNT7_HALPU|nr:DUF502 domain-containing protein [Haladaptatus paucihalophilus]EFW93590.1 hypothetical protein ZOD2009_00565 [Haladaptatus paucihalophilus DX253]SHL44705.1 Uncharacterized membrane protein [Haladaptatus paucihalophilus DX253]
MSSWKRDAGSGLIVLAPLLVTAYIIAWLFLKIAGLPFLEDLPKYVLFGGLITIPAALIRVGIVLAVFTALVFSIGYLMRTTLGSVVENAIDGSMNRLPGLRIVYNASKMAAETALSDTNQLQKPVKIETWNGLRMTAFKTGKQAEDGRELLFLPTAPNITTGFVIEVESDDITETDESVEDALTRILSAGFGESDQEGIPINVTDEADDRTETPPST